MVSYIHVTGDSRLTLVNPPPNNCPDLHGGTAARLSRSQARLGCLRRCEGSIGHASSCHAQRRGWVCQNEATRPEETWKPRGKRFLDFFLPAGRISGQKQPDSGSIGDLLRRIMDSPVGSRWGERMLLQRTHSSLTACRSCHNVSSAIGPRGECVGWL